jgi:hypothetical protein
MDNKKLVAIAKVIAATILELGEVPAGHLYAGVMGSLSLDEFESIIGIFTKAGLVEGDRSHLLRWIGPKA